jgi:hypothetical protein
MLKRTMHITLPRPNEGIANKFVALSTRRMAMLAIDSS